MLPTTFLNVTVFNELHLEKTPKPRVVREFGKITLVRVRQTEKASRLIVVMLSGKTRFVKAHN
jgi:hypothetical protein